MEICLYFRTSDDEPVPHGEGPVALGCQAFVVSDYDDGLPKGVPQAEEEGMDVLFGAGIEVAGGFIGKEDGGGLDDGTGNGDALLLASGKLRRLVGCPAGKANLFQEVQRPFLRL